MNTIYNNNENFSKLLNNFIINKELSSKIYTLISKISYIFDINTDISDKIKELKLYIDNHNFEDSNIYNVIEKFLFTFILSVYIKEFKKSNQISKDELQSLHSHLKKNLTDYLENILIYFKDNNYKINILNNIEIDEEYDNDEYYEYDEYDKYDEYEDDEYEEYDGKKSLIFTFNEFIFNLIYSPLYINSNILDNATLFGNKIFKIKNYKVNSNYIDIHFYKLNSNLLKNINIICKFNNDYYGNKIDDITSNFNDAYAYYTLSNNSVLLDLNFIIDCFLYNIYEENDKISKYSKTYNYDLKNNYTSLIPIIIFNHELYHGIFFNIIHKEINEYDLLKSKNEFISKYENGKYEKLNIIYHNLLNILLNGNNLTTQNLIITSLHYDNDVDNISELLSMIISNGKLIKYVFENNYVYQYVELISYFNNILLKTIYPDYNYDFNYLKIYNELYFYGKMFYDELIIVNNLLVDSKSNNLYVYNENENKLISTKLNVDKNIVNDYEYCINELNRNLSKTNNEYLDKLCIKLYLLNNNINYLELFKEFDYNDIYNLFYNKLKLKLNKNTKNEIELNVTIGIFYNNNIYYSPFILNDNILFILKYNYELYSIYKDNKDYLFNIIKNSINNYIKIDISDNNISEILELYIKNNKELFELYKYNFTDFVKTSNYINFALENENENNIKDLYDKYIEDFIKNNNIPDINYNSYIFNNIIPNGIYLDDGSYENNEHKSNINKFFINLLKNNSYIFYNKIKYKFNNEELHETIKNYYEKTIETNTSEEEQINILNISRKYIDVIQSIFMNYLFRLDNKTKKQLDKIYSDFIKINTNGDSDYIPVLFHHSKIFKNKKLKLNEAQISAIKNYSIKNKISLIHEVGLGKTLSSIACLSHSIIFNKTKNAFIVTPVKVFNKWRKELIGDNNKYGLLSGIKDINVYSINNISTFNKKYKNYNENEKIEIDFYKHKKIFFNEFKKIYYIKINKNKENITDIIVDNNKINIINIKNLLDKYKTYLIRKNTNKFNSEIKIVNDILHTINILNENTIINNFYIIEKMIFNLLINEIDTIYEFNKNYTIEHFSNVTNYLINKLFDFSNTKITELQSKISQKYSQQYYTKTFEIIYYILNKDIRYYVNIKENKKLTYTEIANYCKKYYLDRYKFEITSKLIFDNLMQIIFINYLDSKYENIEKYYLYTYGKYEFIDNNKINIFLIKDSLINKIKFIKSSIIDLYYNYSNSYKTDFENYIINNNYNDDILLIDKFNIDTVIIDEAHNYNKNFEKIYNIFDKDNRYGYNSNILSVNLNYNRDVNLDYNRALIKLSQTHSNKSIAIYLLINSIINKKKYSNKYNKQNIILLTATPYKNNPIEVLNFLLNANNKIFYLTGINNSYNFVNTFFNLSYKQVFKANNKFGVTYAIESINNKELFKQIQNNNLHIYKGDKIIKRPEKIINPIDIYSSNEIVLNYINEKQEPVKEIVSINNFNLSTKIKPTSFQSIVFNAINSLTETYFDFYNQEISKKFNTILKNALENIDLDNDSDENKIINLINNNYENIFNTTDYKILLDISQNYENYLILYISEDIYERMNNSLFKSQKSSSIRKKDIIKFLLNLKKFTYGIKELSSDEEDISEIIKSQYQLSLFVLSNIYGRIIGICPFATHLYFDYFFSYDDNDNISITDYNEKKEYNFRKFKELVTIEANNNSYFKNILENNEIETIFNTVYDLNNYDFLNKYLVEEKQKNNFINLIENIKTKNNGKINSEIINKEIKDLLLDIIINSSSKLKFVIDYLDFLYYNNIDKNVVIYSSLGNNSTPNIDLGHIKYNISEILIDYINKRYNYTTFTHSFQIEDDVKKTTLRQAEILTGSTPLIKREAIISAYEQNKIKVLYTSVKEGVDLQKNTIALINISIDWNYTDNEQIEGRVWRFGNENLFVNIIYPLLLNSADIAIFEKNIEKKHRIKSLLNNDEIKFEKNTDDDSVEILLSDNSIIDMVTDIRIIAKNIIYNEVIYNIENLKKIDYDLRELIKLENKLNYLNFNDYEVLLRYYLYKIEQNINIYEVKQDIIVLEDTTKNLLNKITYLKNEIERIYYVTIDYLFKNITYFDSVLKTNLINKNTKDIENISKDVILKIKKMYYQNLVNTLKNIINISPDIKNNYEDSINKLNNIQYNSFIDSYEDEFNVDEIKSYIFNLSKDEIENISYNNDIVLKISNKILNEYKDDYYDFNKTEIKSSIKNLLDIIINIINNNNINKKIIEYNKNVIKHQDNIKNINNKLENTDKNDKDKIEELNDEIKSENEKIDKINKNIEKLKLDLIDLEEINKNIKIVKKILNINKLDINNINSIKFDEIFNIDYSNNFDNDNFNNKIIEINNKLNEFIIEINSKKSTLLTATNDYNKNKKLLEEKEKYINEENFIDYEIINDNELKNVFKDIEDKNINIDNYKILQNREVIFFKKNEILNYIINNDIILKNKYGNKANNTYLQIPTFIGTLKDIILKLQNINYDIYNIKLDKIIDYVKTINEDEFILKYLCGVYNSDINKIKTYLLENNNVIAKSGKELINNLNGILQIIKYGKKFNSSVDVIKENINKLNNNINELYTKNEYLKEIDRKTIENISDSDMSKYIDIIISSGGSSLILKFLEKANDEINNKTKNVINSFFDELENSQYKNMLIKYKDYKIYNEDTYYDDEFIEVYDKVEIEKDKVKTEKIKVKVEKDKVKEEKNNIVYEHEYLSYNELYNIINKKIILEVYF